MESFLNGKIVLHVGDCMDLLPTLADNSLDSCVTDPPYHLTSIVKRFGKTGSSPHQLDDLAKGKDDPYVRASAGFMGKQWDGGDVAFRPETWTAVYRVLKPGAHLLAFGGTRTYHRMVCAIEDAGFEIRDCIQWLYGSGFPKSHDVSKGIDRAAGAEREVVGQRKKLESYGPNEIYGDGPDHGGIQQITAPATDAARQWEGWGTALKPACEPIVLARKPLSEKTVAANVLRWGTGALNIDACRVGTGDDRTNGGNQGSMPQPMDWGTETRRERPIGARWPANVIHDGSAEVVEGFPDSQSGMDNGERGTGGIWQASSGVPCGPQYGDSGSAARYFYTAKADSDDRIGSKHPTVKPLDLMQYLVRLVTPKGGTVLDPFAGTGTTGEAAFREGMKAVLIEREAEYQTDIRRRIDMCMAGPDERSREMVKARGLTETPGPLFEWDAMWRKPFDRPELVWGKDHEPHR